MKGRFGRNIRCQVCGKDDKIATVWRDGSSYHYFCSRCNVRVRERHCGEECA